MGLNPLVRFVIDEKQAWYVITFDNLPVNIVNEVFKENWSFDDGGYTFSAM